MGSIAIPSGGGSGKMFPVYTTENTIKIANKQTDYTLSSAGSRVYFVTNKIKGSCTISFVYGDRVQLVRMNADGTTTNISTGTHVVDDTVLGFTFYDIANHIAGYKFNFDY